LGWGVGLVWELKGSLERIFGLVFIGVLLGWVCIIWRFGGNKVVLVLFNG